MASRAASKGDYGDYPIETQANGIVFTIDKSDGKWHFGEKQLMVEELASDKPSCATALGEAGPPRQRIH
jgi:hypothetical protein